MFLHLFIHLPSPVEGLLSASSPVWNHYKKKKKRTLNIGHGSNLNVHQQIDEWIRRHGIYIYNGILLSHKREWNWVIHRDVDRLRVCHPE